MSADNSYFVIRQGDQWRVAHGFYSPWFEDAETYIAELFAESPDRFTDRATALVYAHDAVAKDEIVEYGVTEVVLLEPSDYARVLGAVADSGVSGGVELPPEGHYYGDDCLPNGHGVYWTVENTPNPSKGGSE